MIDDTAGARGAAPASPAPEGTAAGRLGRPPPGWRRSAFRHALGLGGAAAALALAIDPAPSAAQWRAGQDPGAGVATTAATLEDYARMLQAAEERLRMELGVLVGHGVREFQEGAMPPAQQSLLDSAQTALVVVQNAPAAFRDEASYVAAERQVRDSIAAIRSATAPTSAAVAGQEILNAMARLRQSMADAARNSTAAGGPVR